MSRYDLGTAFEDVSRAVLSSGSPMNYETRFRAAVVLHAAVRAGHAAGMPDTPTGWATNLADNVVATMRTASPPRGVDGSVAEANPWALREAAAELQAGLLVREPHDGEASQWGDVELWQEHADHIEDNAHDSLDIEDEQGLDEYDAELRARS